MNPKFLSLNEKWSIKKSIKYIKDEMEDVETTN